jgi:DNA-binding response OmpR family regulator
MHSKPPLVTGPVAATAGFQRVSSARILVVDDDLCLCAFNAEILETAGFEVDVAEDGEAGWLALRANDYDLLITDNNMPKISGIELLKRIRGESLDIPVIMVSGAVPTEELGRHPGLGLAATVSKPYTGETLLRTVKQVLADHPRKRRTIEAAHA